MSQQDTIVSALVKIPTAAGVQTSAPRLHVSTDSSHPAVLCPYAENTAPVSPTAFLPWLCCPYFLYPHMSPEIPERHHPLATDWTTEGLYLVFG